MRAVHKAVLAGKVLAAAAVKEGGIAAAVTTMCLGNQLGFEFIKPFQDTERLFTLQPGGMVLEKRHIDSLTEEEENWRRQLVNGTVDGRIPEGESMQELSDRVNAALESCRDLPQGSRPLLVSHGIALGCLVSTILGLPAWAERRLRLRNCSISRVDYQESLWLASGWVVETAGDISHLDAPALDELQR